MRQNTMPKNNDKICPIMTRPAAVPSQAMNGTIQQPGQLGLATIVMTVVCQKEKCMLWDESSKNCIIVSEIFQF